MLQPFAIAAEISRKQPSAPARRSSEAVHARWRQPSVEAVAQLEPRRDLRAVPARPLFVALVEQALGVELAQPVERRDFAGMCLAFVVASPRLLKSHARTIDQMRLINALCRFVEIAEEQATSRGPSH